MVERYHLLLAVAALSLGLLWAVLMHRQERWSDDRVLAAAGLTAALLGGSTSPRSIPWALAAVVVAMQPSRDRRPHPLGRWVVPMAAVSAIGIWSAVPDTEAPLAVAAVLVPIGCSNVISSRSTARHGSVALVVAVLGATWVGSAGWGAAMMTGSAVGMVAVAPMVLGFGRDRPTGAGLRLVVASHLAVALVLPRFIMGRTLPVAAGIAAVGLVGLALVARSARGAGPVDER